MISQNQI